MIKKTEKVGPLTPELSQIRAEVERVSFRNEENGWSVIKARLLNHEDSFTVTGHFASIHPGEQYELFGNWTNHAQYGRQFKVERFVPVRPSTAAAIERFLASGLFDGIGPKTANKIVKVFGDETLDILDHTPQRLYEVPAIGKKKAQSIIATWQDKRTISDVILFLNSHGISPLFANRIYKTYGRDAISVVSQDPYRLAIDIQGIGFLSADRIAKSIGISKDSTERIRAAILYSLRTAEEQGHCFLTTTQLSQTLGQILELEDATVDTRLIRCLGDLNELGLVFSEKHTNDSGQLIVCHYRADLLFAEATVSDKIKLLNQNSLVVDQLRIEQWLNKYIEASGTTLSDEQLRAVISAVSCSVFILTGGPGVGKTTTANAIIRLLKAMGRNVALAAPTGRAAQRLTEVAAAQAKTIHRLLEWSPRTHSFERNEENPLPFDTIVVDESSMLDIRLAQALFSAIRPNAQLILIGDVDQLPSVGPGNVLSDLIDSETVHYVRLTRIFRQASFSQIIQAAHAINSGKDPDLQDHSDGVGSDCQFIEVEQNAQIREVITQLLTKTIPKKYGFNPLSDVQILTPMNRGELGTQALNDELQDLLNPLRQVGHEVKRGQLKLRPGDKVIQSSNNYDLGVFNGDIGFIQQTKVSGGKIIVKYQDGRVITYDEEQASDLRLAYAITIHKSQGSEFPVAIIPASMQHYVMLQRNLIYTGLTRAKKLAIFVGAKKALSYAISNQVSHKRQTLLSERLQR